MLQCSFPFPPPLTLLPITSSPLQQPPWSLKTTQVILWGLCRYDSSARRALLRYLYHSLLFPFLKCLLLVLPWSLCLKLQPPSLVLPTLFFIFFTMFYPFFLPALFFSIDFLLIDIYVTYCFPSLECNLHGDRILLFCLAYPCFISA